MDEFLAALGAQAMKYAIRSGIALTSSYAIGQCSRLLKTVHDKEIYSELRPLEILLDSKIKVISPAIDLVEFKSGRGNVFLDSALPLASSLHREINSLGQRIEVIAEDSEYASSTETGSTHSNQHGVEVAKIITDIKALLDRIDREIPLLQLAITASGESLSSSLPASVSPSRLLQASTLLTVGDTQYARDPTQAVQIGPAFNLSLYLLFLGHAPACTKSSHSEGAPVNGHVEPCVAPQMRSTDTSGSTGVKPIWQEVIHKARVRLCRNSNVCHTFQDKYLRNSKNAGSEYAYYLEIIEDMDDGRVHDQSDEQSNAILPRMQERIPLYQLSKIFYTDSGRILNIGSDTDGGRSPVLLLKRDLKAVNASATPDIMQSHPPEDTKASASDTNETASVEDQAEIDQQLLGEAAMGQELGENQSNDRHWGFPKHLDPEWMAMQMYEDPYDEDDAASDNSSEGDEDNSISQGEVGDGSHPGQSRQSRHSSRPSLDAELETQITNLSLRSPETESNAHNSQVLQASQPSTQAARRTENFISRSPFRAITSSLSLIEMLIRLASLQEFQQASHLSIPDHVMAFFLEETSTTGLSGEAEWKIRKETTERVGFDPYSNASPG